MAYLTDRALASGVTLSDLLHIVIPSDVSQNPDGSSYKATIQQVGDALSGSSFNTYVFSGNADVATSTLTFLNNSGSTFTVTNSAALFADNDINVTGGTYNPSTGCVTFTTNSGTTFDVCGFLTGFTDTYVTGGTYSSGIATFTNNNGGTFGVTGFTQPFTGNTSGDCITDLFVSNIHSCSPLNINPLDEGNVYFGSTSAVTIDLTNNRVGINTSQPDYRLDIQGTTGRVFTDIDSAPEQQIILSAQTTSGITNISVSSPNAGSLLMGIRGVDQTLNSGFGKAGDSFIYSSVVNNGLNIISQAGSGTDDYIRFYAGQLASTGNTPDLYIQGSGSTRGYIGINNDNPTYRLDVTGQYAQLYVDTDRNNALALIQPSERIYFNGNPSGMTGINLGTETNVGLDIGQMGSLATNSNLGIFGKPFDTFIRSNSNANNLNIITSNGSGKEDHIRFYAKLLGNVSANTSSLHIQGSGSTKGYIGINNDNPTYRLDISGTTGRLFYDSDSVFSQFRASTFRVFGNPTGNTEIAIFQDDTNGANALSLIYIGTGTTNTSLNRIYGGAGDAAMFASSRANNLNIINTSSTGGTSDNIRFYAGVGGVLSSITPDIHIQGSGSTRGYIGINNENPQFTLDVAGETRLSGSGQNILTVIGSGDTQPLFTVQGSSGELFSITDSLVGSLFSVNDISGLPILEVFDDDTIHMGNYQAPSLNTTVLLNPGTGLSDVYSIPVSAYTGAFFDYTVLNSTGARAGSIMSIFSGSTVEFSETTTNDIGSTSDVTFTMSNDGSNAKLQVSATTTGWEVKTIVRSI